MATDLTYEDHDLGFGALLAALESGDGLRVETGLHDPEQAIKGLRNEVGTQEIPARPWLSIAADTAVGLIEREGAAMLRDFGPTSSVKPGLEAMGKATAEHTKGVIVGQQVGGPPLAAETIERKGHALKLIDSGEMLRAIGSKVLKRGES